MAYKKRLDGRAWEETRPIEAKAGVIKNADGSAYFKIGKTIAYAAVYGPRELHPKFLQNPKRGILRCYYDMMPFSGVGDRVRPGASRRSKEIGMVSAIAVGKVDDKIVADLNYDEEAYEEGPVADIPVAVLYNTKEITLLQMDGEISKEELLRALDVAKHATDKIAKIQFAALKEKYTAVKGEL